MHLPQRTDRERLLLCLLPTAGTGLPDFAAVDLRAFWARFDAVAPVHLRWGLRIAACVILRLTPLLVGFLRPLDRLDPGRRERVLAAATAWPVATDLVQVGRIVAALAYFDDAAVERHVRGGR